MLVPTKRSEAYVRERKEEREWGKMLIDGNAAPRSAIIVRKHSCPIVPSQSSRRWQG